MRKFNEWLAVKVTLMVSTMWACYVFILYGLIPAIWPQYQDKILYWSNFAQLVYLPVLSVGAAVLSRKSEKQAQETHDAVMEELQELKDIIRILQRKAG